MRGRGARARLAVTLALAVALGSGLTACVGGPPAPTPTASPTAGETTAPEPEINLGGTATENQPYFDQANLATIELGATDGRSFIDGLVAAGYTKESMEVTPDRTTVNAQADNIQFSVRLNGTCLVGQYGGSGYASFAGPLLADGRCLIGTTRPIDW
ncbi:MAG: hypothetical protein ABIQ01_04175 [Pseudolysinimonas sp.]